MRLYKPVFVSSSYSHTILFLPPSPNGGGGFFYLNPWQKSVLANFWLKLRDWSPRSMDKHIIMRMNIVKKLSTVATFGLILLSFTACTDIYFSEAMPAGEEALSEIPQVLRGRYIQEGDTLWIHADGYATTEDQSRFFDPEMWADSVEVKDGLAFLKNDPSLGGQPFTQLEDTFRVDIHRRVEESLSDEKVIKAQGEYFFFSEKQTDGWAVAFIQKKKNGKLIGKMIDKSEEQALIDRYFSYDLISENGRDEILVDASTADLVRYIKAGGFKEKLFTMRER